MLPGVTAHRRVRMAAASSVVLAFVGLCIGHTLEYVRVWGLDGLVTSVTSPLHAYMLPVAGALAVLCALFALRVVRAWRALNDRLDRAATGLRRIWRGQAAGVPVEPPRSSSPAVRLVAIWLPLAAAQIALYLVQENVEAVARSQTAPGWGALSGIHWAAPFVHLYVSLLLACGLRICQILLRRRATVVERVEALLRVAIRRVRVAVVRARPASPVVVPPLQRFGGQLWRRPPPLLLDI
jgi:hypothetical protein